IEFIGKRASLLLRHVDDQKILHAGSAQFARSEAVRQIRGCAHLLWLDAASEHRSTHVAITVLLLGMDTRVIAVKISRRFFWLGGIQVESNTLLKFFLKLFRPPAG